MVSVIIPAYNEAAVIGRCLETLLRDPASRALDIVVVCNGCTDNSADVARSFGDAVRVIETSTPSKSNALNLGDEAAKSFPRVYLDADIAIDGSSILKLAEAVGEGRALAAAPRPINLFLPGTAWSVRAFYRFWMALPHIQEGMVAAGAYVLSEAGRARFERFPDVIADDGYVRLLFDSHERVQVGDVISEVYAPMTLDFLIRTKTRARIGVLQLQQRYPELYLRETKAKNYRAGLLSVLGRPRLYFDAIAYAYISIVSRRRAARQFATQTQHVWERDESSRDVQASRQ
ncbi:MAG: glycosyltransferase family 2 protein [Proteobacteria bacterium]|nr:glycosyltransferase family 2 protein [Pseudomonadota bacterium]